MLSSEKNNVKDDGMARRGLTAHATPRASTVRLRGLRDDQEDCSRVVTVTVDDMDIIARRKGRRRRVRSRGRLRDLRDGRPSISTNVCIYFTSTSLHLIFYFYF